MDIKTFSLMVLSSFFLSILNMRADESGGASSEDTIKEESDDSLSTQEKAAVATAGMTAVALGGTMAFNKKTDKRRQEKLTQDKSFEEEKIALKKQQTQQNQKVGTQHSMPTDVKPQGNKRKAQEDKNNLTEDTQSSAQKAKKTSDNKSHKDGDKENKTYHSSKRPSSSQAVKLNPSTPTTSGHQDPLHSTQKQDHQPPKISSANTTTRSYPVGPGYYPQPQSSPSTQSKK